MKTSHLRIKVQCGRQPSTAFGCRTEVHSARPVLQTCLKPAANYDSAGVPHGKGTIPALPPKLLSGELHGGTLNS